MTIHPYFSSIRHHLSTALEKASKHISVAVCWFTNDELFNILCQKLENGVTVELIILDDYINSNPYGCEFSRFIALGGQLYLSNVERPMHNKYCLIDNKILINGSYNWTYFAETRNEENIIIFEECDDLINAFNSDFSRLKEITKKIQVYKKKPLLEFENSQNENTSRNAFSAFNLLSNDLFIKAIETNNKACYQAAKSITPDNISFQKKAVELKWDKPIKLETTLSEKIKGDRISKIFSKGTTIPAVNDKNFTTIKDNQKSMAITLLMGENEQASKNSILCYYPLKGIPPLKAGDAIIETEYKISINGKLYITKYIHDTGLVDKKTFDLKTFNLLKNE